ncbi:MAG: cyclic nucleotide-binding domain-containing protein [Bdellovibrionota bacterium]
MTTALWAIVAQFAYLSMLFGLLGRNFDLLRKCFLLGSALAVAYSLCATDGTLWIPLLWNSCFLVINGIHLAYNRAKKRRETLDAVEQFLKRTSFASFPAHLLKTFVRMGMEGTAKAGQPLVNSEAPEREVVCILKGTAKVMENGNCLYEIKPGRLVGVLSYLCEYAAGDVVAASEMKVIVWTAGALEQWVGTDPARLAFLQSALGSQLVEQLTEEREARRKMAAQIGGVAV